VCVFVVCVCDMYMYVCGCGCVYMYVYMCVCVCVVCEYMYVITMHAHAPIVEDHSTSMGEMRVSYSRIDQHFPQLDWTGQNLSFKKVVAQILGHHPSLQRTPHLLCQECTQQ